MGYTRKGKGDRMMRERNRRAGERLRRGVITEQPLGTTVLRGKASNCVCVCVCVCVCFADKGFGLIRAVVQASLINLLS